MFSNGYFISRYMTSGKEEQLKKILAQRWEEDRLHETMHEIYKRYFNYLSSGMSQKDAYDTAFNDYQEELQQEEIEK